MTLAGAERPRRLPAEALERMRRTRRHPRPSQFDYLHVRRLLEDLAAAVRAIEGPVRDVLDVYCGTRPYEDLFPASARYVGLDVAGNPYGLADVTTDDFLPFPDESFDVVACIEGFHYVPDPAHGVGEMQRVLRPGGTVIVTVPFVWEYDRAILEHRYTGPELAALFAAWDEVEVVENGGRAVAWATLTGSMMERAAARVRRRPRAAAVVGALLPAACLALNGWGAVLDQIERRSVQGTVTLPMNLMVTARRPSGD